MGFLQNHAIKKSCRGLAKELLSHVANYISQLPQAQQTGNLEQLMQRGLENFVENFTTSGVNLNLKSIQYSNWIDLYVGILLRGVRSDLSYDPTIGTYEHDKLIGEVGEQVFDSWVNELRKS